MFADKCIAFVAHRCYNKDVGGAIMSKSISMSIRVSQEELEVLKEASKLESYSTYSEFIRRTALKEANRVIEQEKQKKGEIYYGKE